MKSYKEYDEQIKKLENFFNSFERDFKTRIRELSILRRKAYEQEHPSCQSTTEIENHGSHSWFETIKCVLPLNHNGRHHDGNREYW